MLIAGNAANDFTRPDRMFRHSEFHLQGSYPTAASMTSLGAPQELEMLLLSLATDASSLEGFCACLLAAPGSKLCNLGSGPLPLKSIRVARAHGKDKAEPTGHNLTSSDWMGSITSPHQHLTSHEVLPLCYGGGC